MIIFYVHNLNPHKTRDDFVFPEGQKVVVDVMFSLTCQTYFRKLFVAETISFFLVYYKFFFVICIRVYMLLGNFYKCKPINKNIAFTSKSYIKAIGVTTIYIFLSALKNGSMPFHK